MTELTQASSAPPMGEAEPSGEAQPSGEALPKAATLGSNRDIYLFIRGLSRRSTDAPCITLRAYLDNLRTLAGAHRNLPALPLPTFGALLETAFEVPHMQTPPSERVGAGYMAWDACIRIQIQDLHEMEKEGMLANEHRYFGLDAPRGARWYNFDPGTYLECAVAGTFGGWEDGDDTGRVLVPGNVAVVDESGSLVVVDPSELEEPTERITEVSWEDFLDFLEAGQSYE